MASNHTEHFSLNQWLPNDQVIRTDFNEDNAKVDAALSARNCQMYWTTYKGTGTGRVTLAFPQKPILVILMDGDQSWACGIQGTPCMEFSYAQSSGGKVPIVWKDNTMSWSMKGGDPYVSGNILDRTYFVVALLDIGL